MTRMDYGGRSAYGLVSPLLAIFSVVLVVGDTLTLFSLSAITLSTALAAFYLHYLWAKWLLSCCHGVATDGALLVISFSSDCDEIGSERALLVLCLLGFAYPSLRLLNQCLLIANDDHT